MCFCLTEYLYKIQSEEEVRLLIINKKLKNTKEYHMKNSMIIVERIYFDEKNVKELVKEYLQKKIYEKRTSLIIFFTTIIFNL